MWRKPAYYSEISFQKRLINVATMSKHMMKKYPQDKMYANHNQFFNVCLLRTRTSSTDIAKYQWTNSFHDSEYWKQIHRFIRSFKAYNRHRKADTYLFEAVLMIPVLEVDYERWINKNYEFALSIIRLTNGSDVVEKELESCKSYENNPRRTIRRLAQHPDYRVREAVYSQIDLLDDNLKKIVLANI